MGAGIYPAKEGLKGLDDLGLPAGLPDGEQGIVGIEGGQSVAGAIAECAGLLALQFCQSRQFGG